MTNDSAGEDGPQRPPAPVATRWRFRTPAPPVGSHAIFAWVVVFAGVMGTASLVDVVLGNGDGGHRLYLWTLSLGLATGAAHGLAWALAYQVLALPKSRLPARVLWPLLGLLLAAWLGSELGVLERLGGEHRRLAWIAIAACVVGGGAFGLGALGLQPCASQPRGWIGARHVVLRVVVAALLLPASAGAVWVDRNYFEGEHASAHLALRIAGIWGAGFAVMVVPRRFPRGPRALRQSIALVLVASLAFTVLTLRADSEKDLHAILERPYSSLALESARALGDLDFDGYSAILGGTDCAPFDADVNPGAREIPGNGVDENCRRGDARARDVASDEVVWPTTPSPTSILLVTVDTVSAPHMSLYGSRRRTTPQLDRWATRATVFENSFTSGGWTSLAISSLMRGVYPRRLEWTRLMETSTDRLLEFPYEDRLEAGEQAKQIFGLPIHDLHPTLAEWMRERGMYTAAVVNDGSAEFLDPEWMGAGFDVYVDLDLASPDELTPVLDGDVTKAAIDQLQAMPADRPFFLWVHYFGPHYGNTRHPGLDKFGYEQRDRYEHELLYMDQQVTRLLRRADRMARDRPLAILMTSDHGEVIRGKTRAHGLDLRERAIRVPLLVRADGLAPGRVEPVASIVDVMPTILDLTESPVPPGLDGTSLLRIAGDAEATPRVLLVDTWRFDRSGARVTDLAAAFDGEHKLTLNLVTESRSLHRQGLAPRDGKNLLDDPTVGRSHLLDALESYVDEHGAITLAP